MITINNLDILFGDKHLFNNVSARINDNDRIGLVGVNGAGKSTLLKIICGLTETDPGVINRPKRFNAAYLPQEATALDTGRTIYQEAENAFAETMVMQQDLDEINRQLAAVDPENSEFSSLLKQQGELQHRLEKIDIFRMQSQIEKVLMGLGFSTTTRSSAVTRTTVPRLPLSLPVRTTTSSPFLILRIANYLNLNPLIL